MDSTDDQMAVINEYNRLDAEYRERMEVKAGVTEMKQAIWQVLAKEITTQADMVRLEKVLPGITKLYAKAMGYSEAEFDQQLQQGLILTPSLIEGLEKILNDPFMQV